jgi:HK97 gp10 family phage protein
MAVEIVYNVAGIEEFKIAMEKLNDGTQHHVHRLLESWAKDVEALAKQLVPVRTGNLRSSIYAKVHEWVAEIGAEAAYALFVELGTRYMQAKPYLYPALQEHLPRLEQIIGEAIDAAKMEAGLK